MLIFVFQPNQRIKFVFLQKSEIEPKYIQKRAPNRVKGDHRHWYPPPGRGCIDILGILGGVIGQGEGGHRYLGILERVIGQEGSRVEKIRRLPNSVRYFERFSENSAYGMKVF